LHFLVYIRFSYLHPFTPPGNKPNFDLISGSPLVNGKASALFLATVPLIIVAGVAR